MKGKVSNSHGQEATQAGVTGPRFPAIPGGRDEALSGEGGPRPGDRHAHACPRAQWGASSATGRAQLARSAEMEPGVPGTWSGPQQRGRTTKGPPVPARAPAETPPAACPSQTPRLSPGSGGMGSHRKRAGWPCARSSPGPGPAAVREGASAPSSLLPVLDAPTN